MAGTGRQRRRIAVLRRLVPAILAALAATPCVSGEAPADPAGAAKPDAGFVAMVLRIEGDRDYGAYLAGDCVTCHQLSGGSAGIPPIAGLPAEYFVRALYEYRTNIRSNEVMKSRVASLTEEEFAALAAYFGALDPQ